MQQPAELDLAGRVAVVTGGAGGIGSAIVDLLAARGASVAVCDLDAGVAGATGPASAGHPGRTLPTTMDIASSASIAAAMHYIHNTLGPVDILINNVGVDRIGPFVDSTEADWLFTVGVNLRGTIAVTRVVLDDLLSRGSGRIISISSDAAKVGSSLSVVYSASKAGVISFSKALAREVAATGITVNCVCPGPTRTAFLDQLAQANPKVHASMARAVPMRRLGEPSDIASTVAFLASDEASFVTGQAWSVSGGLTMV